MLLEAKNLKKYFKTTKVQALDRVSFSLGRAETLGIAGESGSGKSTLAKLILRLIPPDEGQVLFEGNDISRLRKNDLKDFRRKIQIVFQEPYHSLDPRMRIEDILKEPLMLNGQKEKKDLDRKVSGLLKIVELSDGFRSRLPHQLSGGECQRVAIARAISLEPSLIVCDEAVSSLDAIVQAQILNLFLRLQQEKGLSYLFISHDLRVIRHMSDRVIIMRDGHVCEEGSRDQVFMNPQNSYTKELLNKLPRDIKHNI